jgi:hypothetical protein
VQPRPVCVGQEQLPPVALVVREAGRSVPAAPFFRAPAPCLFPAAALRPAAETAVWGASLNAAVLEGAAQPDAEGPVEAGRLDAEGAPEEVQPDAAVVAALPDVAAGAVVQPGAAPAEQAPDVVEAAELPVVPAGLPSGLPSALAWVFRQDRAPPAAPPRSALTAHAMALSTVAWLSERSWQAALGVVLSCALDPAEF